MIAIDKNESPIFRAHVTTAEERVVREFILQLKLGKTRISYYKEKFGVDVLDKFAAPLKFLQDQGFFSIDGDYVCVSRGGLLQIDRLLHEFFLPEHRDARYT